MCSDLFVSQHNSALRELSLRENEIEADGAAALGDALKVQTAVFDANIH
jgi:hypothetical protein